MWGTYWVWDARLTSELILLFLYIGFMALQSAIDDPRRGDRAGGVLALVGAVNVPIIYFSVKWWNTLHQPSSVMKLSGPSMPPSMLKPLLIMAVAYAFYAGLLILIRMQNELMQRRIETARLLADEE